MSENSPDKRTWTQRTLDKALKFNRIFQISTVCAALWFSWQSKKQAVEIESLTLTNAYLLAQTRSGSRAINETPLVWWKKELFPETGRIVMQNYNDAFYDYMLKPIGVGRYFYVRKEDKEVFSHDIAAVFYKEDFDLYIQFLKQPVNEEGYRPMLIKEYDNHWVDLSGNVNKDGYWRFVREEEGHIFIYGMLKRPKEGEDKEIVINNSYFVQPKKIKIQRTITEEKA